MPSRVTIYILFVAVGFVITTANLLIYTAITKDSKQRRGLHHGLHHDGGGDGDHPFTGGDEIVKPLDGGAHRKQQRLETIHGGASIVRGGGGEDSGGHHHPHLEKPPATFLPANTIHGNEKGKKSKGGAGDPPGAGASSHQQQHRKHNEEAATSDHRESDHKKPHGDGDDKKHHHGGATPAPSQAHHHHHEKDHAGREEKAAATVAPTSPHHHKKGGGAHIGKKLYKYVASESDRTFANITYSEALDKYHQFLSEDTEDIEQSSNKFKDIAEHSHAGVQLPTDEETLLEEFGLQGPGYFPNGAAYCDSTNADYTPETDKACIQYLSDIRNMLSIKPMSSILSSGRTIKFKVYYKHNNVTAVLKVSQKKFALEPASEAIALQVDRWLGFGRVPPVAWAPIPQDFLRAASATMDAFYSKWFEKFVLQYDTSRHLTSTCYKHTPTSTSTSHSEHRCLNVSLQIWMADVHNADETILKPSQAYRQYLELPPPDSADAAKLKERLSPTTPKGEPNPRYIGLAELMDEFVFDLIIGNTDRWFGHNSFALGGCTADAPCGQNPSKAAAVKSKSSMRLAFIDQGSSFYRKGALFFFLGDRCGGRRCCDCDCDSGKDSDRGVWRA
ncbi:transmembrane protein, putative [Bodo saltans]|uniref:Transmembrane protein, putative n=1 Tax=Bodo saltans TaxID=75058 RepID=A0A0S4IYD6_BODSA|nr:transmembrane protein, putative [Bodo saltans]|eukprot:CUG18356.1 transmembrane protein, putative [Bodo saltans]